MNAPRTAFLVNGKEPFLKGFTVYGGQRPQPTSDLRAKFDGTAFTYETGPTYAAVTISPKEAERGIATLGKTGAYTHSLGRYWALRTLESQPFILRAFSRRYPHILVDEAQDIGPEHQAILEMLVANGSQISLIGDQNQGIYDFSGATGKFLGAYGSRAGISARNLTINFRSVPAIVGVANRLAARNDSAHRPAPARLNGAFFVPYKKAESDKLLSTFRSMVATAGLDEANAAIVCRSTKLADQWRGGEESQGQGVVRAFVDATISRDKLKDFSSAFSHTCTGIVGLLHNDHGDLQHLLARGSATFDVVKLRRAIWAFAKDPDCGLPAGTLMADTGWHPLLRKRLETLLPRLEAEFGLRPADNLGNKLAKKALLHTQIVQLPDLAATGTSAIRVSTVHQVKGESIDGVMYVADKGQVQDLLNGTTTEVGRIGYVAVTRARNLFVLAVPDNCVDELEPELLQSGFLKP